MTKALAYLRVSDQSQAKKGKDGFPRQERAIQSYAKTHGIKIAGIFKEDFTGTEERRPVLAELLVSLEQNSPGIRTVIIERLDRLARDLMVQEAIIRDLQKQGYTLISAVEGPDLASDDPTRKLIRQVLGAIAEYDKSMTVQKLRAARDRKRAKTGRCEGRKPYGETQQEQAVLRRMRAMRRNRRGGHKGMTLQAIADRLNSEGISTKTGGDWSAAQVYHALNQKKKAGRSISKNRI